MRPVFCAIGITLCVLPVLTGADLTVLLDFEDTHAARPVAAMEAEAEKLLTASGVSVAWRPIHDILPGESFPKLAVVKFTGHCELTPLAPAAPEDGSPLGFTHSVDGRIIPFGEVECDRVRGTLAQAHQAIAPETRDALFGRALGRVLAHELFHILSGSTAHANRGLMQRYLSAAKLVEDRL